VFCKDRAGHALLSDCSTNERSAFIAIPLPFRGDEDRIGGSAIPSTALLQVVVKQHPSPQMTCFAMLDSEEPRQGSIPNRGQLLVNPKTVN